jgi:VWFA-related protein
MSNFNRLAAALLLAAGFALQAQQSTGHVALRVVALDSAGNPVPDLTAADFALFGNGSPQKIVSLHLNQSDQGGPLVILFDLMNSNLSSRGEIWSILKTSLSRLPATGSLYLYLLVEDGSLYAVHGLPEAPAAQGAADASWVRNIGPLLDTAMRNTLQFRPQDLRRSSPVGVPERFTITCRALDDMGARMAMVHGPKELLWVTYGFPSAIGLEGQGWWDGGPTLRELGARLVQSKITVYTADPGMNLDRGVLNRDSLDILTGATGGRTSTVDLNKAITQAEADARTNYSLEYEPPARNWDGKYHKLRVTVARKGIRIQSEHGYYAALGS